jgi:hypothetical protein
MDGIFQVVGKMSETQARMLCKEGIQLGKIICNECMLCAGSQQAIHAMGLDGIILVVQKTKDVELAGPAQHLFFELNIFRNRIIAARQDLIIE